MCALKLHFKIQVKMRLHSQELCVNPVPGKSEPRDMYSNDMQT